MGPRRPARGLLSSVSAGPRDFVDLMVEPMSFDRIGNLGNYVYGNYVYVGERARLL